MGIKTTLALTGALMASDALSEGAVQNVNYSPDSQGGVQVASASRDYTGRVQALRAQLSTLKCDTKPVGLAKMQCTAERMKLEAQIEEAGLDRNIAETQQEEVELDQSIAKKTQESQKLDRRLKSNQAQIAAANALAEDALNRQESL